ncbi:MAG: aminotransferase class V-fold PLP-dependent enzyme [Firmicutes bacterium]|nr:aminotransferase class V-fold PLP-dependent enzyme [Bacillota bacterium]
MDAPLYNRIAELSAAAYPLHMPGHKRCADFLPKDLLAMDLTEIAGSDDLHAPSGVIADAQQKMAALYGSDECIFCVNGGSSGVLAAVLGTCGEGDTVLTVRNAHKSLQNALILSGADAVYAAPPVSKYGFALPITPEIIENSLKNDKSIKAVFIVSPTYEGCCADVEAISRCVHKYGKILIVDETHGAHFPFDDAFPVNASRLGADISVQSWHKTLPVPNQCALLNINYGNVDVERIKRAFSMVTTTSPSYILMGLMDYVRAYYTQNGHIISDYAKKMTQITGQLDGLRCLAPFRTDRFDISKITLTANCTQSTADIANMLRDAGFELEMTGIHHLVAMTSPADRCDMLDRFVKALEDIDRGLAYKECGTDVYAEMPVSEKINQRKVFYGQKRQVPLKKALGLTAADFVTPFPPDIPVIIAGEKISAQSIETVVKYADSGAEIHGLNNGKLYIV